LFDFVKFINYFSFKLYSNSSKVDAIWFEITEADIDDDFKSLFSKTQAVKAIAKQTKITKTTNQKQECIKLLDSKRSQAIGILITSKRLDLNVIRDALIEFNNELLSYETLNSIYAIRPQEEEIRTIQEYLRTTNNNDDLLDKPELFLYELYKIPAFETRIYCLVFQNRFNELIASIEFRLNNINTMCEELMTSEKIKKILGIILACGNFMNATNKTRGDADGFDLAILPNLKDVKSRDNTTNLLNYIVYFYVNKIDDDIKKLPVPDSSDFNSVAQANFDDLEKEILKAKNELKEVEERVDFIIKQNNQASNQTEENEAQNHLEIDLIEPFKTKVTHFIQEANDYCKEQEENLDKCKAKFKTLVNSFGLKPKSNENEITPQYFFGIWSAFCHDFKESWKRESQRLNKQRLKEINDKRKRIKSQSTEVKPVEKKSIVNFNLF
jgi:hypothetical protein